MKLPVLFLVFFISINVFAEPFERGRPEDVGLNGASVQRLLENLRGPEAQRRYKEVHSLIIYKENRLVTEAYFSGNDDYIDFEAGVLRKSRAGPVEWDKNRLHYVASVNKSITALLTGIAFEQLDLDVDQRVIPMLDLPLGLFSSEAAQSVTFDDFLSMQAGFDWDEWGADDLIQLWKSKDFVEYLGRKNNQGSGKHWVYNSALPNLLLTVLQDKLSQPVGPWADRNFFKPLGIAHYRWGSQPTGVPEGAARMYLKPLDMLKIGTLILKKGKWQGRQIVPESWIEKMTREHAVSDVGRYGYYLWLRELSGVSYYSLDGDGGQYVNIFPALNTIIVMTQGNYLEWPMYRDQAEALMKELLVL